MVGSIALQACLDASGTLHHMIIRGLVRRAILEEDSRNAAAVPSTGHHVNLAFSLDIGR